MLLPACLDRVHVDAAEPTPSLNWFVVLALAPMAQEDSGVLSLTRFPSVALAPQREPGFLMLHDACK
jgi:hypothetical protein